MIMNDIINTNHIYYAILLIILCIIYIRVKHRFWLSQPMFNYFKLLSWLYPQGYLFKEQNRKFMKQNMYVCNHNIISNRENSNIDFFIMKKQVREKNLFDIHSLDDTDISIEYTYNLLKDSKTFSQIYDKRIKNIMISSSILFIINEKSLKNFHYLNYYSHSLDNLHLYTHINTNKTSNGYLFHTNNKIPILIPFISTSIYCFNIPHKKKYNISPNIKFITISSDNINLFYHINKDIKKHFNLYISHYENNILQLVNKGNLEVKIILNDSNIVCIFVFRENMLISSYHIDGINNEDFYSYFLESFQGEKIKIMNISYNYKLINHMKINRYISKTSLQYWYTYNFIYTPFNKDEVFMCL